MGGIMWAIALFCDIWIIIIERCKSEYFTMAIEQSICITNAKVRTKEYYYKDLKIKIQDWKYLFLSLHNPFIMCTQ